MFTVSISGGTSGLSQSIINSVRDIAQAAGDYWARYIDLGGASIDIEIDFEALGASTLANAGPTLNFVRFENGNAIFEAGTIREIRTGIDPNGSARDIAITINQNQFGSNGFYLDDLSNDITIDDVPNGQVDLFSTLIHEIGHGLGFLSFLDDEDTNLTTFDLFVNQSGSDFTFIGENAVEVFGGPVPLASIGSGGPSHLSNSLNDILDPIISSSRRMLLSELGIAIFEDIGLPVFQADANDNVLFGFVTADQVSLQGGNDRYTALAGNDTINGDGGNDTIFGGAGNDVLNGGSSFDNLEGGTGNDLLNGGGNADNLFGGVGEDTLEGGQGFDRLFGQAGNDVLLGGNDNDALFGQAGNDQLFGGIGDDRLFGGSSFDTLQGEDGDDFLSGGSNADNLFGGAGEDTLEGGQGFDRLFGQTGNDVLLGGSNNDALFGGAGFDTLNGGSGDDRLFGNFNADTFVFDNGFGNDTIGDFNAANLFERIDLSNVSAITNFDDLVQNHLDTNENGFAVITDGDNSITLTNVSASELSEGDFIF